MYEEDNTLYHGIIDLLIDANDYYIIVDYKLKNIDDSAYVKQLMGYKKYIEMISNKKVNFIEDYNAVYDFAIKNNMIKKHSIIKNTGHNLSRNTLGFIFMRIAPY